MLRFICDCGQRMNAPDRLAGTTVLCLGCHAPIVVREMVCPPTGGGVRLELGAAGIERILWAPTLQPIGAPSEEDFADGGWPGLEQDAKTR